MIDVAIFSSYALQKKDNKEKAALHRIQNTAG
jgi:hypothetical protein